MRILTSEDHSIIIRETDTAVIRKLNVHSDLHVVIEKKTGREFGLLSLEKAEEFVRTQGWQYSNQRSIERQIFAMNRLLAQNQLTDLYILNLLEFIQQKTTWAGFIQIFNNLKEHLGNTHEKLFERINISRELIE